MTTPAVGLATRHRTIPYMTVAMYKQEPTALPTDSIVPRGTPQQGDAMLAEFLLRSAQEINSFCYGASGGVLHATVDTETLRLRINRFGQIIFNPRFTPVLALNSFQYGVQQSALFTMTDLSNVEVEPQRIIIPVFPFTGMSSAGPLQFGVNSVPGTEIRGVAAYVNGHPVTQLAASTAAGATSFTVQDATGIYPNFTWLTIRDGIAGTETVLATSVSGTTIGCAPLSYAHAVVAGAPIQVDWLPDDITNASAELTTGMLKRKQQNTADRSARSKGESDTGSAGEDNFERAYELLSHYMQVRAR